jgi:uncharacterized protein YqeY
MLEIFRERLKTAMKNGLEVEKNIFRVLIGEISQLAMSAQQNGQPVGDDQIHKIIRKLIEGNKALLDIMKERGQVDTKNLAAESEILSVFLPKLLTLEEIRKEMNSTIELVKAAKSEGQALGMALGLFKKNQQTVNVDDVKQVVVELRK